MRTLAPSFAPYIDRWCLTPDGDPIVTRTARLLPVRRDHERAVLKIATMDEARSGVALLTWWNGRGAARVFDSDHDALLIERATGARSLLEIVRDGRDDEATRILCDVIAVLHEPRANPPPKLMPLRDWFAPLAPVARTHGGLLARADETATALLAESRDVVPLHGDIHHGNVLDFGARGWLAIDPHAIFGARAFDYANIFCNPDLDDATLHVARDPLCFRRRLEIVTERSGLDRRLLLQWILAWTGLSAAWFINDGESAEIDLAIAAMAAGEIDA